MRHRRQPTIDLERTTDAANNAKAFCDAVSGSSKAVVIIAFPWTPLGFAVEVLAGPRRDSEQRGRLTDYRS
jgi:hypothetical protein